MAQFGFAVWCEDRGLELTVENFLKYMEIPSSFTPVEHGLSTYERYVRDRSIAWEYGGSRGEHDDDTGWTLLKTSPSVIIVWNLVTMMRYSYQQRRA